MQDWQRNLYIIWAAELTAIAGFSLVFPFLPYYVQELGVTELSKVELWSGLLLAGPAAGMAVFSPIWGSLADRYGRKLMVERAMFGGAVLLGAMGLVHNVWQLAILRILQGCITGTVLATTTLVASGVPRWRSGYALGLLQMAVRSGASIGPLLGGVIVEAFGYRAAFWTTAALLLMAGLSVLFFVEEEFDLPPRENPFKGFREGLTLVLRSRAFLALVGTRLAMRLGSNIVNPMLPLFVQSLMPDQRGVASLTGLIMGVSAATSALGAAVLGRIGDRIGHRQLLVACALGAAVLNALQFFVTMPIQLLILQSIAGVALGGTLASISAALAHLAPKGQQGVVYGVDAGVASAAKAVAPMVGAAIAAGLGLRFVFPCAAGCFALAALGMAGAKARGGNTDGRRRG